MKITKVLLISLAVVGMSGCATATKKPAPEGQTGVLMPGVKTIYFDFDRSEVKGSDQEIVTGHSKYLAANPGTRIRVEGHCDERGSREYNVGLGERRAQAVRRMMLFQGVADNQIESVSYGEERPAMKGHSEEAWSRNRRAEVVYLK